MALDKIIMRTTVGLLLALVLLAVALRDDVVASHARADINATPDVVWDYITDPKFRPDWMESVTGALQTAGTTGFPNSSMMLDVMVDGRPAHVYEDTINAAPPLMMETLIEDPTGAIRIKTTYRLRPIGDTGTQLSIDTARALDGFIAPFFAYFMQSTSDANVEGNLRRLKVLIERRH